MKLIIENWRKFVNEETEAEFTAKEFLMMTPQERKAAEESRLQAMLQSYREKQARQRGPQMSQQRGPVRKALVQPKPKDEQDMIDASYADGIRSRSQGCAETPVTG